MMHASKLCCRIFFFKEILSGVRFNKVFLLQILLHFFAWHVFFCFFFFNSGSQFRARQSHWLPIPGITGIHNSPTLLSGMVVEKVDFSIVSHKVSEDMPKLKLVFTASRQFGTPISAYKHSTLFRQRLKKKKKTSGCTRFAMSMHAMM